MADKQRTAIIFACWAALTVGMAVLAAPPGASHAQPSAAVSGTVSDANGPVAGATVRVQGTLNATLTDEEGHFTLAGLPEGIAVTISAWADSYYCAKAEEIIPPDDAVTLTLVRYQTGDNPAYEWVSPVGDDGCASCKPGLTQIWLENDAHAGSSANPRFLTMYNGTDIHGNRSPLTLYGYTAEDGRFPLPPDLSQPYYGPGYLLDWPRTRGNCGNCHTPGAALDGPSYGTDPNTVSGADEYGVHCDFCHKVADVYLDPRTGLPYPDRPGVLSMDVRRPFPDDPDRYQLFFGTFDDDNVPEEDTYLPLMSESQFCAPCHYGVFFNTVVYNSFGEWLGSPYADPEAGQTCQDCHMPAPSVVDGAVMTNIAPDAGGIERDPMTIHAHTNPGAASEALLRDTAELSLAAARQGDRIEVTVAVTNTGAGHHIPTDSPLRQIFAIVTLTDGAGNLLPLEAGPILPDWAGDLAGAPGVYFARILQETRTGIAPTGSYWSPTRVLEDTRLPTLATASSRYTFAAADAGPVTVEARLLFRRAFYELMQQKGWDVPDILMASETVTVP